MKGIKSLYDPCGSAKQWVKGIEHIFEGIENWSAMFQGKLLVKPKIVLVCIIASEDIGQDMRSATSTSDNYSLQDFQKVC